MPMHVEKLFCKPAIDAPLISCSRLQLQVGWGIVGDSNAHPDSFRQVLLVSRPALDAHNLPDDALRGNVLLDDWVEDWPSGTLVTSERSSIKLLLTYPCEPCVKLDRLRPGLAKSIRGQRGMLARVLSSGELVEGEVLCFQVAFPPIPEAFPSRLKYFLDQIPVGHVTTFEVLRQVMGLTRGQLRKLPTWLKKQKDGTPVHRVVTTQGDAIPQHVPAQLEQLASEGIQTLHNKPLAPIWRDFQ